jgi:DNA-binding transcriptional ArsR family regulator
MRKLREILRLHLELGMSARSIARSCSLSPSTVSGYLGRVKVAKLSWPLPPELNEDGALTRLLLPTEGHPTRNRPEPNWAWVYLELRKKHVPKQLLWEEYKTEQLPQAGAEPKPEKARLGRAAAQELRARRVRLRQVWRQA